MTINPWYYLALICVAVSAGFVFGCIWQQVRQQARDGVLWPDGEHDAGTRP